MDGIVKITIETRCRSRIGSALLPINPFGKHDTVHTVRCVRSVTVDFSSAVQKNNLINFTVMSGF